MLGFFDRSFGRVIVLDLYNLLDSEKKNTWWHHLTIRMNEVLFLWFSLFLLITILFVYRTGKNNLYLLVAIFTLMMNIFVLKEFELFGFIITGWNALYGALFLISDILAENHGKKAALKAVKIGFLTSLFFIIASQILIWFSPSETDFAQEHLKNLFSILPRVLIGSLLAYIIAQTLDVYLFWWFKRKTDGKFLWLRNNGSTLISQFVDTLIFTAVWITTFSFLPEQFAGFIEWEIFWSVVFATYSIKVIFSLIDTPFLYFSRTFNPEK